MCRPDLSLVASCASSLRAPRCERAPYERRAKGTCTSAPCSCAHHDAPRANDCHTRHSTYELVDAIHVRAERIVASPDARIASRKAKFVKSEPFIVSF